MFGGIPKHEIKIMDKYWSKFPSLKRELFDESNDSYITLKDVNIEETIVNNKEVKNYFNNYNEQFSSFKKFLENRLIDNMMSLNISQEEETITQDIFTRLEPFTLVDKYKAYQVFNDEWVNISLDLEIIQTEGFQATKKVDPNMVTKKRKNKEVEVQEGWLGRIIPFDIVQKTILKEESNNLKKIEQDLNDIEVKTQEIIDELDEEYKEKLLNDTNDAFNKAALKKEIEEIREEITSPEISQLNMYLSFLKSKPNKQEKLEFIDQSDQVDWDKLSANKDGTFGKIAVNKYLKELISTYEFPEDSMEYMLCLVEELFDHERQLNQEIKVKTNELHATTKDVIENLTDTEAKNLLVEKWIHPLIGSIDQLSEEIIKDITDHVKNLSDKYSETLSDIMIEIEDNNKILVSLIDELEGDESDMKGLSEFQSILKGDYNGT